ncbi:MAG: MMPL family transporter [Legionellaceae bacterium]|nr:MMPL family transporter [Legionellaceae bacterium]
MRTNLFFRLGEWVYRFRLLIIVLWTVIIISCIPLLATLTAPFQSTGFEVENSESVRTKEYLDKHLGYHSNRFIAIYQSKHLLATNPLYINKLKKSLSGLKHFPMKHEIIYPDVNAKQISKDKHSAYVVILFKDNTFMDHNLLLQFQAAIKPPTDMRMRLGGEALFIETINQQTQEDLYHADSVAAPASIITLILVFGTIIAALVPIVLGGGCALIILTTLYFLGHLFSLSIFTLNIALLLGLCLSLDYSLFIIYRFREELHLQDSVVGAVATTIATAGKSVFFSGLAVFVSLSALLLFPINILFSVGVGGLVAVFGAVAIAVTLLPAILAVLKQGINRWSIRFGYAESNRHLWGRLAAVVVSRPFLFFFSALLLLLCLAYPFMHVRFGISDMHILPTHTESYQFIHMYEKKFNENELAPIVLVVKSTHERILSKASIKKIYDFAQKLKKLPLVENVDSIVTTTPALKAAQYYALYNLPKKLLPPSIQQLLKTTSGRDFTVINVVSKYGSNSAKTMKLITQLQQMHPGKGLTLQLTGEPVNNAEVIHSIAHIFPYAVVWIMILTYVILLVLLRSLFLPFKAIVMNVLSLCASYGVLVFVFQEGNLHQLLNFNPQGMLDISLLIIIFCALFGFSMDYEVFLLTRIKECHELTHDTDKSIVFGIDKSCRIITSAAIIVIVLCGSFMLADVLMVKEFGLGIAIAIFVDAFIIRVFLVPAIMAVVKEWNWYLPRWLDRILP